MLPSIDKIKQGSILFCDLGCEPGDNVKRSWTMIVLKKDNFNITLWSDRFNEKIQTLNYNTLNWYLKKFCQDFI